MADIPPLHKKQGSNIAIFEVGAGVNQISIQRRKMIFWVLLHFFSKWLY
jgi:hypothetical protein